MMGNKAEKIQNRVGALKSYKGAVQRISLSIGNHGPGSHVDDRALPYYKELQTKLATYIEEVCSILERQIETDQAKLDAIEELLKDY